MRMKRVKFGVTKKVFLGDIMYKGKKRCAQNSQWLSSYPTSIKTVYRREKNKKWKHTRLKEEWSAWNWGRRVDGRASLYWLHFLFPQNKYFFYQSPFLLKEGKWVKHVEFQKNALFSTQDMHRWAETHHDDHGLSLLLLRQNREENFFPTFWNVFPTTTTYLATRKKTRQKQTIVLKLFIHNVWFL